MVNTGQRQAIGGAATWRGPDLARSTHWIHPLTPALIAEIDAALERFGDRPWQEMSKDDFPLPELGAQLQQIGEDLEEGCGVAKVTGLPVDRYNERQLRTLFYAVGSHLGTPVQQNGGRGLMRDIRDNSRNGGKRVDSAEGLDWHNDRADVVGLFCIRRAQHGGVSRIVSATAIHDTMLARRPELVETLFGDFHRFSPGDEVGAATGSYPLPVFAQRDGYFTSHYSSTYIDQAQGLDGVPPLTAMQREALDMLIAVANELSFEMPLAPGDMQFLNNHIVYHGRTPFRDDAASGEDRLLYRLWLSMPNSRPLPENHAVLWGNVDAGALRGGIRT
jgi:hypothetical protein